MVKGFLEKRRQPRAAQLLPGDRLWRATDEDDGEVRAEAAYRIKDLSGAFPGQSEVKEDRSDLTGMSAEEGNTRAATQGGEGLEPGSLERPPDALTDEFVVVHHQNRPAVWMVGFLRHGSLFWLRRSSSQCRLRIADSTAAAQGPRPGYLTPRGCPPSTTPRPCTAHRRPSARQKVAGFTQPSLSCRKRVRAPRDPDARRRMNCSHAQRP